MKNDKCQLCDNKLSDPPYKVIVEDENGESEPMHICDECARLMEVISKKMQEHLNDEPI